MGASARSASDTEDIVYRLKDAIADAADIRQRLERKVFKSAGPIACGERDYLICFFI